MKYQKTIDLWNPIISESVYKGTIKLQRGQWVRCGSNRLSRFVQITKSGSLWVAHPQRTPSLTRNRFLELTKICNIK